jgi:predicted site-specific integrase-resolvase
MYTIGKFSKKIGKTIQTLRNWDKKGVLKPAYVTQGKHRVYSEEQLCEMLQREMPEKRINVGYARVSSKHQTDDLKRQQELLEMYLSKQGKPYKIIADIGSGINYKKKGLKELLKLVATNQIERVFSVYKDRLMRFGYELLEEFCRLHNTEVEIINLGDEKSTEEELVEDILNIVHVFSCKINGKRSHINKKIIERLSHEIEAKDK